MKLCRIYCEGKRGSLDYDILEKVLGDLGQSIDIKPLGGKFGAPAIMSYLEKDDFMAAEAKDYLMFRDRDFDAPVPDQVQLTPKGHVYFSYRTTIENYLIDPQMFFEFAIKKGILELDTLDKAKSTIRESALEIKDYQAVRHALGAMRDDASFKTRWTEQDGKLPECLELEACMDAAFSLIQEAKTKSENWTKEHFEEKVRKFLMVFNDSFFDREDYLVWFQGKDLAKSICRKVDNFPMNAYYKFAESRFDYSAFADLVELRTIVENKIQ